MTSHNPQKGHVPIYILTCRASSKARTAYATAEATRVFGEGTFQFVHGFMSDDSEVHELTDKIRSTLLSKYPPLPVEVATYATHRLSWRKLLDSPHQAALVFEDDFLVRDTDLVRQCWENTPALFSDGRNLIKLFDYPRDRSTNTGIKETISGIPLCKFKKPHAGMVGYIISRIGAERFLSRDKVFRVIDEDIKYYWELGLDIWSVPGNPISETSETIGGSLLEGSRRRRRKTLAKSLKGNVLNIYRVARSHVEYHRWRSR